MFCFQPEATPAVSHRDRPLQKEEEMRTDYWVKQLSKEGLETEEYEKVEQSNLSMCVCMYVGVMTYASAVCVSLWVCVNFYL